MKNVKYIGGSGKQKGAFSGASSGGGTGDVVANGNFTQNFIASAFNSGKTLIAKASTALKMLGDILTPDTPDNEGLYLMLGEHFTLVVTPHGNVLPIYEILGNAKCDHHGGTYRYRYDGTATMMRMGSYGSATGFYYAPTGIAGNIITWQQYTMDMLSKHWFNPFNINLDFQIGAVSSSRLGSDGIFKVNAVKRQIQYNCDRQSAGCFWDFDNNMLNFESDVVLAFGFYGTGVGLMLFKTSLFFQELVTNGFYKSLSNITTTPTSLQHLTYEDSNSITTLLTLSHRAVGAASVGIGSQIRLMAEKNNCSGSDAEIGLIGAFSDKLGENSEVFLANTIGNVSKRIIRGTSDNRVYLSDTMMITPEGGIAVLVKNDTGALSVKGYICEASGLSLNGVQLVRTDTNGAIFGVMYENGIANGANTWVVIHGMADVYTWNGTSNGEIIRSAITLDTTINNGQGMSVATLTTINHVLARIGSSIGSGAGAGLKRCKLLI